MNTSHYSPLIVMVWVLAVILEVSLMLVLFWRKAWRDNTAFTSFIAFCVLRSGCLLYAGFVLNSHKAYFQIYWSSYLPQSVILVALVLEVINTIFQPYHALPRGTLGNFVIATFTVALLTITFTALFPGTQPSEWITFLRAMDQGTSWILLGVFGLIVGFASALGIPWRHRTYGIVAGFVAYLSADVVCTTMLAHAGPSVGKYLWPVDVVVFALACSGWIYTFVHSEIPRNAPTMEELNSIAIILSRYLFVIEAFEVDRGSRARLRESPEHLRLSSEGQ